ncbi:ABC transporter permease [Microvirga sp. 17 mud 1-3]|uniref:ABC transporter permease n=1 Tax=Microvirga sp. 17 mud 1-3 TaxID=2082949 RepID=UPI000D6CF6B8|nr:ABC transporter permease [Microvirga sp. 17 mud 1-3]AWM88443.1 peptide ABC transporter [Microvirga sp. 17 mud 1-3]
MFAYVVRRLISTFVVMVLVGVFVFLLLHFSPGDPATLIAGDNADAEQIESIRKGLGLDQPLLVQFMNWSLRVLQGDFGISVFTQAPVINLIVERLEPTVSLAVTTLLFAALVAVAIGVVSAWKAGSWIDQVFMGGAIVGFSLPVFVVGYVLIYIFSMQLKWLPVQGYTPIAEGVLPWAKGLILPTIALGTSYVALIARITRASMLEILSQDYMRTARAKGVSARGMLIGHALRNAGVPIVTIIGIGFAMLISGVVITETVFNLPGVGRLVVDSIAKRDYPVIQGAIIIFSGVYVLINLLIDVLYTLIDPRIRY